MIGWVSSFSAAVVSAGAGLQKEGSSWGAAWDHLRGLAVFPWGSRGWEPPTGQGWDTPRHTPAPGPGHGTLRSLTQSCPTLLTPWTVARQAPLSMGFSRQEY